MGKMIRAFGYLGERDEILLDFGRRTKDELAICAGTARLYGAPTENGSGHCLKMGSGSQNPGSTERRQWTRMVRHTLKFADANRSLQRAPTRVLNSYLSSEL
jgi:hypothetical protein